jgi:hypothetical protein
VAMRDSMIYVTFSRATPLWGTRAERPGTARPGRARLASAPLEMAIRAQSRLDVN